MWRIKESVKAAAVVIPCTYTFLSVVGDVSTVRGLSMQPELNPESKNEDYVLLNRWKARGMKFSRGELISMISPSDPSQKLVKRIVALEGDKVRTLSYKNRTVHIPAGHCWVEGDNYGKSLDSNSFGPVSLGLIEAKVTHVVWPWRRFRRLVTHLPEPHRITSSYYDNHAYSEGCPISLSLRPTVRADLDSENDR